MLSVLQKILQFKTTSTSETKDNDPQKKPSENKATHAAEAYSKDYLEDFLGPYTKGPYTEKEKAKAVGAVVSSLTSTNAFFATTIAVGATALRTALYFKYRN